MADTDDIITDGGPTASPQDAKLDALARSEDPTSYIAERQAQEAEEQGTEPETPADERQNRIDQALEKARADTRQAREANGNGLDLDAQYRDAQAEYQAQLQQEQQLQQQQRATQAYYEARGQCMAKGEQLRQTHPAVHAKIVENLTTLGDVLTDEQGAALEHALVMYPEAVWLLGMKLSNDSDGTSMSDKMSLVQRASPQEIFQAAAQGAVNLQNERYIQTRVMQALAASGRRISNAPPPINPPRGGAGVPKDLFRLAEKPSVDDYVKMRRAQIARQDDR
jgi:hypothetical protein